MKHRPMLVTSGPLRPDNDRYAIEVKWDGFRALVEADASGNRIWSRNGNYMRLRHETLVGAQRISGTDTVKVGLNPR